MPHNLYQVMSPIGQLEGMDVGEAMKALCADACTRSAMAGALVVSGLSPGEAIHTVKAWEGAGLTVAPEVRTLQPYRAYGMYDRLGMLGYHPGLETIMGIGGIRGITGLGMPTGATVVGGLRDVGGLGITGLGIGGLGHIY